MRLSQDPVTLELKRDPKIKAQIRKYLAQTSNLHHSDITNIDLPALNSSTTARASSPSTSRPHGACHRVSSSDPTCRPSRIPTAVRSPTNSGGGTTKSAPQSPFGISKQQQQRLSPTNQQSNGNYNQQQQQQQPAKARFEAYTMTGDLILNLSRTPQNSGLITTQAKKIDSLRDSPIRGKRRNGALAPHAKYDSSPSSPSYSDTSDSGNSMKKFLSEKDNNKFDFNIKQDIQEHDDDDIDGNNDENEGDCMLNKNSSVVKSKNNKKLTDQTKKNNILCDTVDCPRTSGLNLISNKKIKVTNESISSSSSTVRCDDINSSSELCYSVPTSPTSLSQPLLGSSTTANNKKESNSAPTSPESCGGASSIGGTGAQEFMRRATNQQQLQQQQYNGNISRTCDAAGFRTSRSEDHLQATQRDGLGAVIPIDIDEDVNSSLNTLLDTRQDSEDSNVSCC